MLSSSSLSGVVRAAGARDSRAPAWSGRYAFTGASLFIDFMKSERPVAASTTSYIPSTPIDVPLASLIGAFPTRTQLVSPLPDSWRSTMSRLALPLFTTPSSSRRYFAAWCRQGRRLSKSSAPIRSAAASPASLANPSLHPPKRYFGPVFHMIRTLLRGGTTSLRYPSSSDLSSAADAVVQRAARDFMVGLRSGQEAAATSWYAARMARSSSAE